jgi:hypothetical protein
MKSNDQQQLQEAYASVHKEPQYNESMSKQSSSAVYGLFFEVEYEGQVLLGLYNLESEAEAAREHYIALELQEHRENQQSAERKHLEKAVVVRRLAVGQEPSYSFAS